MGGVFWRADTQAEGCTGNEADGPARKHLFSQNVPVRNANAQKPRQIRGGPRWDVHEACLIRHASSSPPCDIYEAAVPPRIDVRLRVAPTMTP